MKRLSAVYEYAPADPSPGAKSKWRGYIDHWDPMTGIHGWALASDSPSNPLKLDLLVGETVFDSAETGQARADVEELFGVKVMAGFRFNASLFARLARLSTRRRNVPVHVRVVGTNLLLSWREHSPTVGELVDSWHQAVVAGLQHHDENIGKGDRLRRRLALMRTDAESFRDLALRPSSESEVGLIDAVHWGSDGLVWFVGWMTRGVETEFPTLIVDRQKYPGGAATLHYERQDLASRFVGFIGVMDTDWTPPAVVKDFFIYVGQGARRHLRASGHTKAIGHEAFLAICRQAAAVAVAGSVDAIGAALTSGDNWMPDNAAAAGIAADACVDRLLMLPGFGCIAEGWAMCPAKRVQTFQMKIADCLLVADESATYFHPRPDVASKFGGGTSNASRAGFVTVLRGALPSAVSSAPLLRVIHDDGTSVVKRLEPTLLQLLDCMSDSADTLRLYPSVRYESFYPALVGAVRHRLSARTRAPIAISAAASQRLIVIRLPSSLSNQRLCFDYIARQDGYLGSIDGICLLADRTRGMAEAKLLLEQFRPAVSMSLSLFCIDDAVGGFSALPFVLSQLGTERFVYVDGGVLLTSRGWEHASKTLTCQGHSIHFFEIVDDTGAPDRINGAVSAACFGWTTAAFLAWLTAATPLIQGVFRTNGLPEPHDLDHVMTGAAIRLERMPASRLADMIDEDLLLSGRNAQFNA